MPKSCVSSDFPNGVGKTSLVFRFFHLESVAGPMATPAGQFIFMKKPTSDELWNGSGGRPTDVGQPEGQMELDIAAELTT
jgi:hypothetical protein